MEVRLSKSDKLVISITATSMCNCSCNYCHFYAGEKKDRKREVINEEVVKLYSNFIKYLKEKKMYNIEVRFSGGEPLMLGEYIYKLSNIVYNTTGIKPYILTNGRELNVKIVEDSVKNNISSYVVSLENPFEIDEFSVSPEENINKIITLNSKEVNVYPGVVIVQNNMFSRLLEICDYYFARIGKIPTISELNFEYFVVPTIQELNDLYKGVHSIVTKYWNKTQLKLFPYIVPSLNNLDVENEWLFEFDILNSLGITNDFEESFIKLNSKIEKSFPILGCEDCDCSDDCYRVKWLWLLSDERKKAYCDMKKTIVDAFFDAINNFE